MNRRSIKLILRLLALVALTCSLLFFQVTALPRIVHQTILSNLADIGLSESTIDVRSCSWRAAELANIKLGSGRCDRAGAVRVEYSLGSLLRGKLKNIQIIGGHLLLTVRDGHVQLGELADLSPRGDRPRSAPPFERIDLYACVLTVNWEGKLICIPCDGTLTNTDALQVESDLRLNLHGIPLELQITSFLAEKYSSFSIAKKAVNLRSLLTALPAKTYPLPARFDGRADIKLHGKLSKQNGLEIFSLTAQNGWIQSELHNQRLDASGVEFQLDRNNKDPLNPKQWIGNATATALNYGKIQATEAQLSLIKTSQHCTLRGEAKADGWHLKKIEGIWPREASQRATFNWEFQGLPPHPITTMALNHGMDLSGLGALQMTGQLLADRSPRLDDVPPAIELSELHIALAPSLLKTKPTRSVFRDVAADVHLTGTRTNGSTSIQLLPGSWIEFATAQFGETTLERTTLALQSSSHHSIGEPTHLHVEASSTGTLARISPTRLPTRLGPARLTLDATYGSDPPAVVSSLLLDSIEHQLTASGLQLSLNGVELTAQSAHSSNKRNSRLNTKLTIDSAALIDAQSTPLIALDSTVLKPITGSCDLKRRVGSFRLRWPLQPDAELLANGNINLRTTHPTGSIQLSCNRFLLENSPLASALEASPVGLTAQGSISAGGQMRLHQGRIDPWLTLSITNGAIASTSYNCEASGIHGAITLNGFNPLTTPGNQGLKIQQLRLGKLKLENGQIFMQIEDEPPALLIEHAEWDCLGGRVYSRATRMDTTRPDVEVRLFADGLELDPLFDLALGGNSTGKGSLYGTIPARVSRSNWTDFTIGEGFLYSTTSNGSWTWDDEDTTGAVQSLLEERFGQMLPETLDEGIRNNILSGLRDFEYDLFKVDFIRQHEGVLARVTTRGHSQHQEVPVEFKEIVLEFPGFDETLRQIMMIRKAISRGHPPEISPKDCPCDSHQGIRNRSKNP